MSAPARISPRAQRILSAPALLDFQHNDYGNACRINALYGDQLLYSHKEKAWFVWDDRRWAKDTNGAAIRCAKRTMIDFLSEAAERQDRQAENFAKRSLDQPRLLSSLSSLQSELPVDAVEFDQRSNLLNFLNGTLDLASGKITPHRKLDKITRLVHYKCEARECPLFTKFLNRVVGQTLANYLQKAFGYSLTGDTSEKVVFIVYGSGNNGKTTLLDAIREIIPEYSATILIESLMTRQNAETPNTLADLADLRGARFANTSETEQGQRLSEGRLKRITQGKGIIKAARKYENPISFPETHKLWIDANHLPVIHGADISIWERLRPIPFSVVIPQEEIDRQLSAKLLQEAEGILAWVVAGAARWYKEGLGRVAAVTEAADRWRTDMDRIAPFLEEMCELYIADRNVYVGQEELRSAYMRWCERRDEKHSLSSQAFNSYLESKGLIRDRADRNTKRVWFGVRFKQN